MKKISISAQHSSFFLIFQLFHFFLYLSSSFFLFQKSVLTLSSLECNQLFFSRINASCLSLIFPSIPARLFFLFVARSLSEMFSVINLSARRKQCVLINAGEWMGVLSSFLSMLLSFNCIHNRKAVKRFLWFYSLELMTSQDSSPYSALQLHTHWYTSLFNLTLTFQNEFSTFIIDFKTPRQGAKTALQTATFPLVALLRKEFHPTKLKQSSRSNQENCFCLEPQLSTLLLCNGEHVHTFIRSSIRSIIQDLPALLDMVPRPAYLKNIN